MSEKSTLSCLCCGKELIPHNTCITREGKYIDITWYECADCKVVFQGDGLPSEARARFMQRPERAWEKAWKDLKEWIFDFWGELIPRAPALVLDKMEQIEKELKG